MSYSWDSKKHQDWVRDLATKLQQSGVEVLLDQWDISPGHDLPTYMETSVRESDYVLLVCTPNFASKANSNRGGVGYEKVIVTGEIFEGAKAPKKFVPILREGNIQEARPSYLKAKVFIDFRNDDSFDASFEELLRHLHQSPLHVRPPLGSKPPFVENKEAAVVAPPTLPAATPFIYCSRCGQQPGVKTTCTGLEGAHEFISTVVKGSIYCIRCGQTPGVKSTCTGLEVHHDFRPRPMNSYCSRCGQKPGVKSTCTGLEVRHDFRPFKPGLFCIRCGHVPGVKSICIGLNVHHEFGK